MRPRIVVLISGRGRNLQAILDAARAGRLPADVVKVISNRADAPGLARARAAGVAAAVLAPTDYADRERYDLALAELVAAEAPEVVALAGFMRLLSSGFVQRFAGKLVNIHPSLLPRHRGLDTHRRALAAGDARHGATVHFVTDELDAGPGILQGSLAVIAGETAQALAQRVMRQVETRIYPQALAWLADGRAQLRGGRAALDKQLLENPIHVECDQTTRNS